MNVKKIIKYWLEGAERSYDTAKYLFKGKRYSDALFFCHLTLEKVLKGLVVQKTKTQAPYTHDLEKLAFLTALEFTKTQRKNLKVITDFNLSCRYDNFKYAFYKKCTQGYTEEYFKIFERLYLWLKEQYQKR